MSPPRPQSTSVMLAMRDALSELGAQDGEHVVQALRRRILVYGSIMMSGGGLLWGFIAVASGQHYAAVVPLSYSVLTFISLSHLRHFKRFEPVRNFLTAISLLLPFLLQFALGGFAASGAMMMWAMIAIVAAITFSVRRQAAMWLFAYLLLTVFSGLIDPYLVPWNETTWTAAMQTTFLVTNITLISSIVFGLAIYHTFARESAIVDLLDERKRSQALVDTLARTEQAAIAESEWMGMFLAKMSHEMRTPISAILGLADVAMESGSSDVDHASMRKIAQVGKHLLSLVDNLLDLFKISGGHMTLEALPFSLAEMLTGLKTFTLARSRRPGVKVHFHVDPDLPNEVVGDSLRLQQVLINLLGNSLKFTTTGRVVLSVTRETSGSTHSSVIVRFAVTDTGVGLTRSQIERLFMPFVQADASTTRRFGGTGLGLAISKEIVSAFQSEIHVESTPGEGSTFSFTLEFSLPPGAQHSHPQPFVPDASTTSPIVTRRTILIDSFEEERRTLDASFHATGVQRGSLGLCTYNDVETWFEDDRRFHPGDILIIDAPNWKDLRAHPAGSDRHLSDLGVCVIVLLDDAHDLDEKGNDTPTTLVRPILFHEITGRLQQICHGGPAESAPPAQTPATLPRTRILLAEDNEIIRTTIVARLELAGAVVVCVENGQQAIEQAQADPTIELILMDIQMPVLDGHQATRSLRAHGFERPIVGLSAGGFPEDRMRALASGMDEHLTKPVEPAHLIGTIAGLTQANVAQSGPSGYHRGSPDRPQTSQSDEPMPDEPPSSSPVFDRNALLERVGGNTTLVDTLLHRFIAEHSHDAELIDRAAAERNYDEVRFVAHRLKGASKTMGAMQIADAASEIELRAASEQDVPIARAALWDALQRFADEVASS